MGHVVHRQPAVPDPRLSPFAVPDGARVASHETRRRGLCNVRLQCLECQSGCTANPFTPRRRLLFINPLAHPFVQLFVGEVPIGSITNNLPAGVSLEGSMLPLAGSINQNTTFRGNRATIFSFSSTKVKRAGAITGARILPGRPGVRIEPRRRPGFLDPKTASAGLVRFFSLLQ